MTDFGGIGPWWPFIPTMTLTPSLASLLVIDATGEKAAMVGRVWFPEGTGSKNISRVGFRFGAITKAGGSALTVSLQNADVALGPPLQPDETQDQTVAIANADAAFATNTWIRTGTFNTTRSVAHGEFLGVVIEFDGAGRLGADSVVIQGIGIGSAAQFPSNHQGTSVLKTGGTWANQLQYMNIILEFDDGTFGTLEGSLPMSAFTAHSFNSGTAVSDEYATAFTVPFECEVDGLWAIINMAASAECELILYQGTTALQTVAIDQDSIVGTGARTLYVPIPRTALSPGNQYYVAVRPTTGNTVIVYSYDVADVLQLDCSSGGQDFCFATRLDQGSWAANTTTRRMLGGTRLASIETGGGAVMPPAMNGGFL